MDSHKAIAYFDKERRVLDKLLEQVPEERWMMLRRSDGWTAAEILGHISMATNEFSAVVDRFLHGRSQPLVGSFDLDRFNAEHRERHQMQTFAEIRAEWQAMTERISRFLAALTPAQWQQAASTPWGTGSTVSDVLSMATYHLRVHRIELQELLGGEEDSDANR